MANAENAVTLTGNAGGEPELRFTAAGMAVATWRIAVNKRRRVGDEWESQTHWFSVVAFAQMAENAAESLATGQRHTVVGELTTSEWEDKDTGAPRSKVEVTADEVSINLRFGTASYERKESGSGGGRPASPPAGHEPFPTTDKPW